MAKKKGILKTLAVGVIGAGIGTAYHFKDNIKNWFDNIVNPEPTPTPTPTPGTNEDVNHSSGGVYVDGKEIGKNDVVSYIPKTIKFTNVSNRTSDNAIVGSSVTINASVLPENATNKNITWSLGWDEESFSNPVKYEYDYSKINEYISIKSNDSYNNSITITLNHVIYDHAILTGKTADGVTCTIDITMVAIPAKLSIALFQGEKFDEEGEQTFLDDDIYLKYRNVDNQLYDSHVNLENNSTGCNGPFISGVFQTGVSGDNSIGRADPNVSNQFIKNTFKFKIDDYYGDDFLYGNGYYVVLDGYFTSEFLNFCESKGESDFIKKCTYNEHNLISYSLGTEDFKTLASCNGNKICCFYPGKNKDNTEYDSVFKFGQLVDEFTKSDDALTVFRYNIKFGLLKNDIESGITVDDLLFVSSFDYLWSPGVNNYVLSTDINVDSDNISFGNQ